MPLKNARVFHIGLTSLIVYSDCRFTTLGLSETMMARFPQQHQSSIIIVNACSTSLETKVSDVFRLRKMYGDSAHIFVLTSDKESFEIYQGIHFVSLCVPLNELMCYIMSAVIMHDNRPVKLSLQSLQIIYMKSLGLEIEDIALLMQRSRSTIKNNFSYCKRRLHIKSAFSERALIYIAKGIVTK
ncbi:hypothetical protein F3J38_01800 [Pantoea sp. Acro-805]|uniref:HTH luxR-type domain-containing protein n=1 Tax=Candidatus Pantoea formicae TaxID=2608355 RepID=A0ABX0QUI0_9GAMM|nr:hypothetical protein [Pantoea formicae]MDF7647476.1 hypothetical protein [Erwiniaceae bacterium L1_54_3]NIE98810.1 hypothetical protein [Pantoea formicae]